MSDGPAFFFIGVDAHDFVFPADASEPHPPRTRDRPRGGPRGGPDRPRSRRSQGRIAMGAEAKIKELGITFPAAGQAARQLHPRRPRRQPPLPVGPRPSPRTAAPPRAASSDGSCRIEDGLQGRARGRHQSARLRAQRPRQPRQGQARGQGARHGQLRRGLRRAAQGDQRLLRPDGRGLRRRRAPRALGGGHGRAARAASPSRSR